MPNGGTLLLIQERLMRNEGNPFLIQNRFMQNERNPFPIQKRLILLVRQGRIAYAPRVPDDRLYDLYEATYKAHIFMPLPQNPLDKRFGLSRSQTQKRPMQNGENLFLIRGRLVQNGSILFSIRKRSMPNGKNPFLIQEGLIQNRMNLFLTQKRLVQNKGNVYGVKKWRLYLYWYPIWRTASSTAD